MSARRNLRSCQRDTKEDESLKKRRSLIAERFPYRDAFEKDFKSDYCDSQTLCVKSIEYLENFQSRDTGHFYLDMSRTNYLTMLYFNCSNPKLTEATRQNEETLGRDPRNFNALWCRSEIFLYQKKYAEVRDSLQRMEELLNDSVQMVTAKAELGVCYPDFGPAFYQKSIQLLEEVLHELSSIPDSEKLDDLRSRMIKWTFDLIHTYNRLMNKGTIQSYWDDSTESRPKHEDLFRRIKELFVEVSASGDLQYTAEAWIELGDAYKKYEEKVPQRERTEFLPERMTVDNCFEKALEFGPDDVFVLERCGRHYRQRATDISEFETAIDFLKRCIERDSYRDVAHHHMGLAYRSMWLEDENHEEARLHTNITKKHGEKRSIKKQKGKCKSSQASNHQPHSFNKRTHTSEGSCACNTTDDDRGSECTSAALSRSVSYAGASLDSRCNNPIGTSAHDQPRFSEPTTPIRFLDTILPKYIRRESEVPKHYRKPDYYDRLRSGNPIAKDPGHKYLMETRSCFQKASDLRQGACCRYLVDLARTYISTGDLTTADALFVQASHSDYSSNDGAYLYEQWGLMAEREVEKEEYLKEDGSEYQPIARVKDFFRKAILFSAESRERSRIAFYHLRDIIYNQIQDNPSDISILQKEHLLLYTTIQDAKKAQEVLDNMKSEESIVLMWQLVDLFHQRNRPEDPDAAFTYLALLAGAKKLQEPVDLEKNLEDVLLERIDWVIEISERRVRRSDGGQTRETLSKAFEWLVTLSDGDIPISEKRSKDTYVVCILAPSTETPSVAEVMTVLTDVIGVDILQGFVEDSPDLPLGKSIMEEIENMVRRARNVVVVMQMVGEKMSSDELQMLHILKPLTNHPDFATKRFCRVVTGEHQTIEYDTLDVHPEWNLDEVDGESDLELSEPTRLAFGLLRALFSSKERH